MARRHRAPCGEIAELDAHIERLTKGAAPELSALEGVGPDTAAALLIAAGDDPDRLRQRGLLRPPVRGGARAGLLGKGGPPPSQPRRQPRRQLRWALHVVALNRLRRDPRTLRYVARRAAEGCSDLRERLD